VIEVRVADQDQVERRELADRQRRRDEASWAGGDQADADADARGEDRIRQDRLPAEAQQDRGVTDPGGGEFSILPVAQVGNERRSRRRVDFVEQAQPAAPAAEQVGQPQRHRAALGKVGVLSPAQRHSRSTALSKRMLIIRQRGPPVQNRPEACVI
jgi:hypothetical protein